MKRHILLFTLLLVSATIFAQSKPFTLKVSGEVTQTLELTLKDITSMPHRKEFLNDRDGKLYPYSDIDVQNILIKAGVAMGKNYLRRA